MTDNALDPKIPAFGKRTGSGPIELSDAVTKAEEPKIGVASVQQEENLWAAEQEDALVEKSADPRLASEAKFERGPAAIPESVSVFKNPTETPHHPTLPSGDTLIQKYEKTSVEPVKPMEQSESVKSEEVSVAAPAAAPVTAPVAEAEDVSVRKIGSTTFRRLDEPVEGEASASELASAIQPVKLDPVVSESAVAPESFAASVTEPAPGSVTASTSEPVVEPVVESVSEDAPILLSEVTEEFVVDEPTPIQTPITETVSPLAEMTEEELALDALIEEPDITDEMIESLEEDLKAEAAAQQSASPETLAVIAQMPAPEVEVGEVAALAVPVHHAADNVQTLLDEHVQWLDSGGAEGRRAVFRDMNLKGTDFSGKRLSGAVLRGLDLTHCRFTQAELVETDFTDCQLHGADFTAAVMDRAILHQAQAAKSAFTAAQLNGADLQGADLSEADFMQAKLQEVNFRDAVLTKAKLTQVTATLANFRTAKMEEVVFDQADLTQAIFREAVLSGASLKQANLTQTDFKDASLQHVDLNDADFSQALGISDEAHAHYMQDQRAKIQAQEVQFERIRSELEQRERSLIEEREQLQRQLQQMQTQDKPEKAMPDLGPLTEKLGKISKIFLFLGIGWFVLTFLLTVILQSVFAQLESNQLSLGEMALMGLLLVGPLVLFVVSMAKCFSLSHALQRVSKPDLHEPQ